jgi:hypothetical protein
MNCPTLYTSNIFEAQEHLISGQLAPHIPAMDSPLPVSELYK